MNVGRALPLGLRASRARRPGRSVRELIAAPYERHMERAVGDAESILDVGCGTNSPLGRFTRRYPHTVGVDLFPQALEASGAAGIHDEYRLMDVLEIGERFEPRSFDAVVAFDLIEHLTRADGLALLAMMERVARRRVVVFTPNGFLEQDAVGDNPLQIHRSGWTADAMRELGYDVRGVNGLRLLRGEMGSMRWRPSRAWRLVSLLTQPVVYRVPRYAFHLLGVKSV
jgi:SAM-dependent methyltransferase